MNCPRCGTSNLDNLSNCVRCGAALVASGDADTFIGVSLPPTPAAVKPAAAAAAPSPAIAAMTPPPDASKAQTAGGWAAPGSAPGSDQVDFGPRYRIDRLLGQGGMGAVYKAWDKELERPVALKLIRPELAVDPAVAQRFKQELLLASKISHKNILRIHDLGEAGGVKFISMAFVEGEDLHQLLTRHGKLTVDRALKIAKQLCSALDAAHSEGVVHRDFKPQNILLDKNENVYVSDFGLAKSLEHDTGMTKSGEFLGTPRYMAPEQVQGGKIDHRVDLYALGLILYEVVTGDVPFHADTTLQLMYKRVHETPKSPKTLNPDLPDWVEGIIMKCLERNPDQRYQNAAEILQDINAAVAPPSVAKTESRQFTFALPVMSRARWAGVIAAILVVAVAIGALVLRARFQAAGPGSGKPVTVLVADFTNHTGDPVFDGTLEPMFNVALEGASFINAFNRGSARKLAEKLPKPTDKLDEQSARLVAMAQNVGAVITGTLRREATGYSIVVKAVDAVTGNTIADTQVNVANKDDVLLAIPKLAAPVRKALGDTTPQSVQIEAAGGAFTAASLEVVHDYGVGMEQQFSGNMQDALQSFSKAAELDPNFARAYAGMAAVSGNLGKAQDAEKYVKLAMEHVDRMTQRERYRIRGLYYVTVGDFPKCIEEYSSLVKLYPSDNIAHNNLAKCYGELRNYPKAIEELQRALEISPNSAFYRMNLSVFSTYTGDFQTGEQQARAVLQGNPSYETAYLALAYAQMGQGQLAEAAGTYDKVGKLSPLGASMRASGLADLALCEGRYSEAARMLETGAAADVAAKNGRAPEKLAALAYGQLSWGHTGPALDAAKHALLSSKKVNVRFLMARVFVEAGDLAKARAFADELASELSVEAQADAKLITGEITLKEKDARKAIQVFTEANKLLDTWMGHFDLGRAYLEAGLYVQADSEFDLCIKGRGESMDLLDGPTFGYFAPVYYYQGRVREGLKSPGFADPYQTYLSIRGKAGEDPLLADVRRRLGQQ